MGKGKCCMCEEKHLNQDKSRLSASVLTVTFVLTQILQKVIKGCSQSMLDSLSLTACQFMEEPVMAMQVRESKHPYDNNTNFEV